MQYRQMGKSGLKLSALSLGAWITFSGQIGEGNAKEILKTAYDYGVNFFDNAEAYGSGKAELLMGKILKELGLQRESYVVSTKIFWGGEGPNDRGLSYKHIVEGVNKALKRLQLDYVDLVFCHRPDPDTPIEETVWAMDQVIRQGKAFYWGTSEWSAADIMLADGIARQNGLRPPSMEQPQYNMMHRERFEVEYLPIFEKLGYGTTIWSPLDSGLLTGKYNEGIPEGSRGSLEGYDWVKDRMFAAGKVEKVKKLQTIADELGGSMAQLALAWVLNNPHVSTAITGASKVEQVHDNIQALEILPKLTDEVNERIETILDNKPAAD